MTGAAYPTFATMLCRASPLRITNKSNYIRQPKQRQPFFASAYLGTSESSPSYRIQPATFPPRLRRACCRQVAALCLLVADKCLHQIKPSQGLWGFRASLLTHPRLTFVALVRRTVECRLLAGLVNPYSTACFHDKPPPKYADTLRRAKPRGLLHAPVLSANRA